MGAEMKRGEVWWVSFEPMPQGVRRTRPEVGTETALKKERPTVILSNDSSNRYLNRVQIAPLSSQLAKIYPSEALVNLNGRPCKAMADQVTTVLKARLSNRAGILSESDMAALETAVRLQFGLL